MVSVPASIPFKSIAGRYRPVRVAADGPITARYRFIKNAYWESTSEYVIKRPFSPIPAQLALERQSTSGDHAMRKRSFVICGQQRPRSACSLTRHSLATVGSIGHCTTSTDNKDPDWIMHMRRLTKVSLPTYTIRFILS